MNLKQIPTYLYSLLLLLILSLSPGYEDKLHPAVNRVIGGFEVCGNQFLITVVPKFTLTRSKIPAMG